MIGFGERAEARIELNLTMKRIHSFFFKMTHAVTALLAAAVVSQAQEEAPAGLGYVRFVNATGQAGRLMVKLNGSEADPSGYGDGEATGSLGLPPQTYQIELKHEGLGEGKLPVALKAGEVTTVIALSTAAAKEGGEKGAKAGEEAKLEMGWHVDQSPVSPAEPEEPVLKLLQFTPSEELAMSVSGKSCPVPRGKAAAVRITTELGAFPEVELAGRTVCLLNFKIPADQMVVFYTGEGGVLKHAQLRNDGQ